MNQSYNHREIEKKWQEIWEKERIFCVSNNSKKQKRYVLDMFPYPSAAGLHVGHPEGYTATDIYCRYLKMNDFEVIHPIGWDAFGLPAENYAIKIGVHPKKSTEDNIKNFTKQIKSFGFSYDWERVINTSDPNYYKWSQWFFLLLYKNGLAYKKLAPVNWCQSCNTVLANEQVVDGRCERCKNEVVQKDLEQWFFRVTKYAEELLSDMDKLDWPEALKTMQRNWIGRSDGAEIDFQIKDFNKQIKVFTTRPDTLYGSTYIVLTPEHKLVEELKDKIQNFDEVKKYIITTSKKSNLERTDLNKNKTGVELCGTKAINPVNKKEIPIYISDYVLSSYGTGAIMCVPAHDERDFEFANKFNLSIIDVVKSNRRKKVLILHGISGSSKSNWYLSLKKDLEKMNYEVIVPDMPDSDKPVVKKWIEALKPFVADFTESDILIGHSMGAPALMHLINKINLKVDKLFLVAPATEFMSEEKIKNSDAFSDDNVEFAINFLKEKIDYKKIQSNVFKIYAYFSDNDPYIELSEKEKLEKVLKAEYKIFENYGHFSESTGVKKFPEIIKDIESRIRATEASGIMLNSEEFDGMNSEDAKIKITEKASGKLTVQYKIRDWLVSRQRYWGAPIPIIYCDKCGMVEVREIDLPVLLPDDVTDFRPTGKSPLASSKQFNENVKCPKCGCNAKRELDTMDGFVDNSWYYYRYLDPNNDQEFCSKENIEKWMPVDTYVGGAEHAVGHLIYSRFFTKVLRDTGYLNFDEPFLKLINQGLILGTDGQKMSKSLGNVVNPDEVIDEFGADSFRMYEMFMGPLEDPKPWNTDGIRGQRRFLDKNWQYFLDLKYGNDKHEKLESLLHKTIKKVSEDIESFKFNTAISSLMIYFKELSLLKNPKRELVDSYLIMLSCFAPHVSEEIWEILKNNNFICNQVWPKYDKRLIIENKVNIPVQVNGKLRASVVVSVDIKEEELKNLILQIENVKNYLENKNILKFIYIKNKIVNIVVS
ncbi:MAG: leucine--tRNA ligase [Patescibacteria group bacterium]|nr:leucine--tRNA ligase [Patescibacteria group bacterium]MDD4303979.1 leucine--tRNA ligase [Patescibacteria group bacterium]MDD4695032.1 leucine--tRNA ligase [Patescibacteria group bacterium]